MSESGVLRELRRRLVEDLKNVKLVPVYFREELEIDRAIQILDKFMDEVEE